MTYSNLFRAFALLIFAFFFNACQDEEGRLDCPNCDYSLSADEFHNSGISGVSGGNNATGENYQGHEENPFIAVTEEPVSTFSIDADGGSYANMRRFIAQQDALPPLGAIRTEEFINYFQLNYPVPSGAQAIEVHGEVSACPWAQGHRLVRIGIQGKEISNAELPPSNIVLLLDVSGSMSADNKLPLLQQGFNLLVDQFDDQDRIAIVTYAGKAGVHLPSTPGSDKSTIKDAINSLTAGGSTAGGDGINTAYDIALSNFIEGGNNRVIIGTDGDFNVGLSTVDEIVELIEEKREQGVFLTSIGVGGGNYNEAILEQMADNGNGTYEYIDNERQAEKVFIHELSKFYTVAKDVKVQIDFNPQLVKEYRLIGYENRLLQSEDFEDDTKDAGEIGAGQNITALYEIIPNVIPGIETLPSLTIDFRYKLPESDVSVPLSIPVYDQGNFFGTSSPQHRFVTAVAGYSLLLLDSQYKGNLEYNHVLDWLSNIQLNDPLGFKEELKELVVKAKQL